MRVIFIDSLTGFVQPGAPLSLVAGDGVDIQSSVYDLLGVGVGVAPPAIIGTASTFGADPGVGAFQPELVIAIGTACTTGNSATLTVQLQAAADDGTNNPSTWTTIIQSPAMTAAQLVANTVIARYKWPPVFPATLRPRFFRLNFHVATSTHFTAGTIAYATIAPVRDDYSQGALQPRNYVVA